MKSPCVRDLEPNQTVTGIFLVHSKEVRQKKSGEPYLSLLLGDRSGDLEAKMWDNVGEAVDAFERDDFIKVKGIVQVYHNKPQLTIHKLRRMEEAEVDFADFFPASERDPDAMFASLREIVNGIGNPHLKSLLNVFLDDEEVARRYRQAPAAKQVHHAFLGGLIEHVLSLCELCRFMASHYRDIDLDLLLAGAILHDVGKIYELSYSRGFSYTSEGQLLGHVVIGLRMIEEKSRQVPGFPRELRTLLDHMVISHHGKLEFGSPKLPLFPEALLLHYLDDLDSKMECMRALVERDQLVNGHFTAYSSALERTVLKKAKYLAGETPAALETPEPAAPPRAPVSGPAPSPLAAKAPQSGTPFGAKLLQALGPATNAEKEG